MDSSPSKLVTRRSFTGCCLGALGGSPRGSQAGPASLLLRGPLIFGRRETLLIHPARARELVSIRVLGGWTLSTGLLFPAVHLFPNLFKESPKHILTSDDFRLLGPSPPPGIQDVVDQSLGTRVLQCGRKGLALC